MRMARWNVGDLSVQLFPIPGPDKLRNAGETALLRSLNVNSNPSKEAGKQEELRSLHARPFIIFRFIELPTHSIAGLSPCTVYEMCMCVGGRGRGSPIKIRERMVPGIFIKRLVKAPNGTGLQTFPKISILRLEINVYSINHRSEHIRLWMDP